MKHTAGLTLMLIACVLIGCKDSPTPKQIEHEDVAAKKMMQGIWVDPDEGDPSFRVKGDTIYYPDSTSQPMYFKIIADTMILEGANRTKYPILRQMAHVFEFKNQNGDVVKLIKSENADDMLYFEVKRPAALNQNKVIKRDTVVMYGEKRYHSYVQINPTTYKVIRPSYNDEGVEVDNVYYDNTIHIALFNGAQRVYSHDFAKHDFTTMIPADFLRQAILSDIIFQKCDADGIHYFAQLCMPDSPSSYVVEIIIGYDGRMKMKISS